MAWFKPDENTAVFMYGCAARCIHPPHWKALDTLNAEQLEISQLTATEEQFQVFLNDLKQGEFKPESLVQNAKPGARIVEVRQILQNALGHTAARLTAYYTMPDIHALFGNGKHTLKNILRLLEQQVNLPFTTSYASRLGNFEVFELNSWLDRPQPFLIEVVKGSNFERIGPQPLKISRTPEFAQSRHIAHIVGRIFGDVVLDRLVMLEPGCQHVPITAPDWLDQIEFRLFDETGETVLHFDPPENGTLLKQVTFTSNIVERELIIDDKLTQKAGQQKNLHKQASTIQGYSSRRTHVGAPRPGSWRTFAEDMAHIAAGCFPKTSQDKWFARGITGEVEVIKHLNNLLHGGHTRRAVLVDPFFGIDALQRFALRMESRDLELTIITSLIDKNPDTNRKLEPGQTPAMLLSTSLQVLHPLVNPTLRVINVADGTDQAFHDRYLLIYPQERLSKIYLLSNSINKAAGDWPFCVSLLADDVSLEVRNYIEGLCEGKDIARGKPLTITFKWPHDA